MKLTLCRSVCVVGVLFFAAANSPLHADPISLNQWYEFQFLNQGTFGILCTEQTCFPGVDSVFAPVPPWTFTAATSVRVILTDAFPAGDSFTLFDFGVLVGSTPPVSIADGCGNNPAACIFDPAMSHRIFFLPSGSHSLTIRVDNSPFGSGAAFFRVEEVPEPASLVLLAPGLAGIYAAIRRRRREGKGGGT